MIPNYLIEASYRYKLDKARELSAVQITRSILHPRQCEIKQHPARFKVCPCGRRFGKTTLDKDIITDALQAGQAIIYTTPTYDMVQDVWRDLTKRLAPIIRYRNGTEHYLESTAGGTLKMWSMSAPDTARGGGVDLIINDECAFVPELIDIWNEVQRPMLLDRGGSAYFNSTPKGHNGFWQLAQQGEDPLQPLWKTFHFTTYDNPHIPREEIDLLKDEMPARAFEQEVLAEFIEGTGMVFRNVPDISTLQPREPYEGDFSFGIDFARDNDYTVISVMDRHTRQQVAIDRFNGIGWAVQRGRIAAMYAQWKPNVIIAERNSIGDVNIEALQAEGLPVTPFQTTALSKPPLIDTLALAIERKDIALLDDRVQRGELQAYTFTRLPAGSYRYEAPSGGHDDTVIALALSWHGISSVPAWRATLA